MHVHTSSDIGAYHGQGKWPPQGSCNVNIAQVGPRGMMVLLLLQRQAATGLMVRRQRMRLRP